MENHREVQKCLSYLETHPKFHILKLMGNWTFIGILESHHIFIRRMFMRNCGFISTANLYRAFMTFRPPLTYTQVYQGYHSAWRLHVSQSPRHPLQGASSTQTHKHTTQTHNKKQHFMRQDTWWIWSMTWIWSYKQANAVAMTHVWGRNCQKTTQS